MGKYKVKVLEREDRDNLVVNTKAVKTDKPHKPRQAPAWFKDFVTNDFRPLVAKVDGIESRLAMVETTINKHSAIFNRNNLH